MTFITGSDAASAVPAARLSWIERLHPRNSVGAATAWLIAAVSFGLALAASSWVSAVASSTLLEQKYKQLGQYAERLSRQLEITLYGHLQSVRATAAILGAVPSQREDPTLRRFLEELQRTLPQFAWAGYADTSGRVVAATGGILEGHSVADRGWFPQGLPGIAWDLFLSGCRRLEPRPPPRIPRGVDLPATFLIPLLSRVILMFASSVVVWPGALESGLPGRTVCLAAVPVEPF